MSKVYTLRTVQKIPASIEEVWLFFSDPHNLKDITPPSLGFTVISENQDRMYPGQIIEYKVSPVLGIPMYWMTEITHVKHQVYFVDEQRFGPYTLWHHQHHFKQINGGVEMQDIVHYKIPFWVLGDFANALFVRKQLNHIFNFRYQACEKQFGAWPSNT